MLLLVDKPKGVTSHDVVDRVREITGEDTVGHGGTLDPNATGLLIVGVTREGTKKLGKFQTDVQKEYRAAMLLGEQTDTLDAAGQTVEMTDTDPISKEKINKTLESFIGTQEQIPPRHSAILVNGERAYKQARKGGDPDVPPRIVEIYDIEISDYSFPTLEITTTVSSGTYIRSLARDIGQKLGCGAYVKELRRTRIDNHEIADATPLADITKENWKEIGVAMSATRHNDSK